MCTYIRRAFVMSNIAAFNETEKVTVDSALSFAARRDPDYHRGLCTAKDALHALAHGISQYPSDCEARPAH
jgi:hypothetical protein